MRVPGTHWPDSHGKSVSSRFRDEALLENYGEESLRNGTDPELLLIHIHVAHICHTYIHTHTIEPNPIKQQ